MIRKYVQISKAKVQLFDANSNQTFNRDFTFYKRFQNMDSVIAEIKSNLTEENVFPLKVVVFTTEKVLYEMSEEQFVNLATKVATE